MPKKKRRGDYFTRLPEDILIEILTRIPRDLLRYKIKYVCRSWFTIITDRILLDHASLILQSQNPSGNYRARLVDINEQNQGLKTKEQDLDIPYQGRIKCWCNEFLLLTDTGIQGSLLLFNLITKAGSILPPCSSSCGGHYGCHCGLGLAFDEFKGVYKVVHVFIGPPIQCEILIINNDNKNNNSSKWKKFKGPPYTGQRKDYWDDPVSVKGRYFHWDVHSDNYLVSMDISKERFRQTRLPFRSNYPMSFQYSFVEMSGFLALLHRTISSQVDIWILRDFQRTIWEKLQVVSISSCMGPTIFPGLPIYPAPVTSLRSKRYLIFRKRKMVTEIGLFGYDLKSKVMKMLDVEMAVDECCIVQSTAPNFSVLVTVYDNGSNG